MIPQTAARLREQIAYFSGRLSAGLCKPARRFVYEMVYGIQARQSVRLSEVGRSLNEPIPLGKTETRLSRNLGRSELREAIGDALIREGASRIGDDTLLVLDLSDITKPHAKKMEHLARVHDGSAGVLGMGYWLCQVVGVENGGNEITPMYGELYSQEADDFVSENDEIFKAVRKVSEGVGKRGVWVIDRGGDRGAVYDKFIPKGNGLRFIIRQKGERHLCLGSRKLPALEIAQGCPTPYATTVIREEKGREKAYTVEYGFRPVRLPKHPDIPLWLVVVKGFGKEPMMLLTNVPMRRKRDLLWWAVSAYITRWRVEETIRFMKQSYDLEDVRVLTYGRLRNIVALTVAAMFFASVVLGTKMKLAVLTSHVLKAAKRIFGIPDFRYYAIADGIKALLTRFTPFKPHQKTTGRNDDQLMLFPT